MVDVLYKNSPYGKLALGAAGARKMSIGFLGESHGERMVAAVSYSLFRHYHADVIMDTRTYANGGQVFAVGGTTTAHLIATQIPNFQARPADIAFIASGYNDISAPIATSTTIANVLSAANSCLAAGASLVVLMGQTPGTSAAGQNELNIGFRRLASLNPRIVFVPVSELLANLIGGGGYKGPTGDTAGSMSTDGTHWSGRAMRLIAPGIADVLRPVCRERKPRFCYNGGAYDPINSPYGNMIGNVGNLTGTAGILNSSFDTGVAGVDATSRLIIDTTGTTLTPSIVVAADGRRKQRLTLSGASSSFVLITMIPSITAVNGGDSARMLDFECQLDLNAVTGFQDCTIRPLSNVYDSPQNAQGTNSTAATYDAATTESQFLYSTYPIPAPSGNNPSFALLMYFNGAPSGSVDISQISAALV